MIDILCLRVYSFISFYTKYEFYLNYKKHHIYFIMTFILIVFLYQSISINVIDEKNLRVSNICSISKVQHFV